jgi:hypothetical protein
MAEVPFVFDSVSRTLICPWSRTHSTLATEQMLTAMLRVLTENGSPHGVFWVHPDRPPIRVETQDVQHWAALEPKQSGLSGRSDRLRGRLSGSGRPTEKIDAAGGWTACSGFLASL